MRDIELQSEYIISRNLVPEPAVRQASQDAQESGSDLLTVLVASGQLDDSLADQIRQAVRNPQNVVEDSDNAGTVQTETILTQLPGSSDKSSTTDPNQSTSSQGIDRYKIIRQMNHGGVGVIYLAQHRALKQDVALKLIKNPTAGGDVLARFEREAQTLARFKHPNIVRVMDYGNDAGNPFIVMELIDGKDLKLHIEDYVKENEQVPDWQWTVGMLDPIADSLDTCHQSGIVHRDLKPQNILIESKTNRPVLVDFGLVKPQVHTELSQASTQVELTIADSVIGTPAYLSPEQIDSNLFGPIGPHTDVWAFGATLYYCLTGHLPFGQHGGVLGLCLRITQDKAPDVTDKNPSVPKPLADLCRRCLAKKGEDRPSIAEVRQVLDELMPRKVEIRKNPVSKVLSATLVLLLLAIGIVWWVLQPPSAELQSLDVLPAWTSRKEIQIGGNCSPRARVIVERDSSGKWVLLESADLAADGRFGFSVTLDPGKNRFRVRVDGDADQQPRILMIGRDVKPPRLVIDRSIASMLALATPDAPVTGQVIDDAPATLRIGDQEIPLDDDGRFSYTPKRDAFFPLRLELRARDAADNEIQIQLTVFKHLYPLMDRVRWQNTRQDIQDQTIHEIGLYLAPVYLHIETKEYVCGAQAHRIAIFQHRRSKIFMHLIPGGEFEMGNLDPDWAMQARLKAIKHELNRLKMLGVKQHPTKSEASATRDVYINERPVSKITVPPILVGRYEVLERHWKAITGKAKALSLGSPDHPQVWVTYQEMLQWLYKAGDGLRLPSEAEWEYACRAGSTSTYFWGSDPDMIGLYNVYWLSVLNSDVAKYQKNPERYPLPSMNRLRPLSVVDQPRLPNAFGLVDTLGNVWEVCFDAFFGYGLNPPVDHLPRGSAKAKLRTKRGGGFLYGGPVDSRCSIRGANEQDVSRWALGFRVVRSLVTEESIRPKDK